MRDRAPVPSGPAPGGGARRDHPLDRDEHVLLRLPDALPVLDLLNVGYLVGFFKHLSRTPFPVGEYFAVTGAALVLIALVGAYRLRREEL